MLASLFLTFQIFAKLSHQPRCLVAARLLFLFVACSVLFVLLLSNVAIGSSPLRQTIKTNNDADELIENFYDEILKTPNYEKAKSTAEAIVNLGRSQNDAELLARGLIRLAFIELRFSRWGNEWEQKLNTARSMIEPEMELADIEYKIYHGYMLGKWRNQLEEGDKTLSEAAKKASRLEHDSLLAQALVFSAETKTYLKERYQACLLTARARCVANHSRVMWCRCAAMDISIAMHLGRENLDAIRTDVYELQKEWPESNNVQIALLELGENEELMKEMEDALVEFEKMSPEQLNKERGRMANTYWTLGRIHYQQGDSKKAKPLVEAAVTHYKVLGNKSRLDITESLLHLIDLETKPLTSENVDALAKSLSDRNFRKMWPEEALMVAQKYAEAGDPGKSRMWQRRGLKLADGDGKVNWQHIHEDAQNWWQAELQARENLKLAEVEEKNRRIQRQISTALLLLGTAMVLGFGFFVVRQKISARQKEELEILVCERTRSLELAIEQAKKADKAKNEFLARMNHEIRNPLTAILGFTEILNSSIGQQDTKTELCLSGLSTSSHHLDHLLNGILEVAQLEESEFSLDKRPFAIRQTFDSLYLILNGWAQEQGVGFDCTIRGTDVFHLYGDEERLKQVVMNLVSNAIKFTTTGGVNLRATCETPLDSSSVFLCIDVEDTGCGIPEGEQLHVFEKFSFSSTNKHTQGSGLGLYISKLLTEQMGGTISLTSDLGIGTVVSLKIPFEIAEAKLPVANMPKF